LRPIALDRRDLRLWVPGSVLRTAPE